ncbi:hypothetical protein Lesp01_71710 [Lentzea sp. NBRC 102530]|nr:hypothetical protein Lesp01_71710 [Lentzea sp. NBRC 102530]
MPEYRTSTENAPRTAARTFRTPPACPYRTGLPFTSTFEIRRDPKDSENDDRGEGQEACSTARPERRAECGL